MENTIENARKFLIKNDSANTPNFSPHIATYSHLVTYFAKQMVAYTSACSAPSSIVEDELKRRASDVAHDMEAGLGYIHAPSYIGGAKWAISRLSLGKIVLPSEKERSVNVASFRSLKADGWNDCISERKLLTY